MRHALPCLALIAACGYPPLDAADAHMGGDSGSGSGSCMAPASYGSPSETGQMAVFNAMVVGPPFQPEEIDQIGQIDNNSPADFIQISLVADTADIPGDHVEAPTSFTLGAPDFKACGACVVLYVKCANCYSQTPTIGQTYMASSGTLEVDSVQTNITGKLTNAKFLHVNIASDGTTTIADSCSTTVTSNAFDVVIQN